VEGTDRVISRCAGARRAISSRPLFRWLAVGAASIGLTAALLAGGGPQAYAEPPLTVAEAKARIAQLETDASAIDQDYVDIADRLSKSKAKLKLKQADVRAQAKQVEKLKFQVGQVALAQFQNRNLDTAAQLFVTSDTEGFLSQISTVEKVSENQNSVLQDYQRKQSEFAAMELSAKTDLAALAEQEKQLKALRVASDKKIAESKAVLAKLTAEEQRKIAAEERRAAAEARKQAESSTTRTVPTADDRDNNSDDSDDKAAEEDESAAPAPSSGGSKGARALAYARAQLGDPYRFAAAGPDAFDCSGLTSAAWKSVGVSLPRSSRSQTTAGTTVSKSALQPGDLVFFYSPVSHVALYAGNGQILHAPRPGTVVRYAPLDSMPFAGAKRPG
jgi:cell wall-associated NlpC family hydrolase